LKKVTMFGTVQDNSGPKISTQDLLGRPLIIWVNDYKQGVGTRNTATTGKLADPVIADIVDLRPPMGDEPMLHRNAWIFSGGLIKSLKGLVGSEPRLVLFSSRPNDFGGKTYYLQDMSGDERAVAMGKAWMEANTDFTRSEAPPDPAPWVPQNQFQGGQPQGNQGWPQGSVPAGQFQGQASQQNWQPNQGNGQPQQGNWQQQPAPQQNWQQNQQQPVNQFGQPQPDWRQAQQNGWQQPQQPAHHEQGPPPAWAVPQGQGPQQGPGPQGQPPMPPQPPQGPPQSVLERMRAQQGQGQPQYDQQQEQQTYGY
jgi:hypothetical protein